MIMSSLQSELPEIHQAHRKHGFRLVLLTQPAGPIPRPGRHAVLRHALMCTVSPTIIIRVL